jgi:hypothetical protein
VADKPPDRAPPPSPDSTTAVAARAEMDDAPPFATWPRIYLFVIAALTAQIVLYAALTAAYR